VRLFNLNQLLFREIYMLRKLASGIFMAMVAVSASADIFTNVPGGGNTGSPFAYFGNAANPSGDSPKVGEVFSLASDAVLSSFSFYALGNQTASFQLNVAEWNPGTNAQNQAVNSVGAVLTTAAAVDTFDSAGGFTTLAFDNLGLSLNANTKYIAYLTSSDPAVTHIQLSRTQTAMDASGFGIGHAFLSTIPDQGWQLPFSGNGFLSLEYTAVTAVPEPEIYALMVAGLGLMGFVGRRRKSAQA
jgi:PEP-CTERM motif-containing protein